MAAGNEAVRPAASAAAGRMGWRGERIVALPILQWLPAYRRQDLRPDLIAGMTAWALVLPQAVAYGQIAGVSAQAGLAAAVAGPLFFANARKLRQDVLALAGRQSPPPRAVLFDLEMSAGLDIESADVLADTRVELARLGIDLWLGGVHPRVADMLRRTGFETPSGPDRVFDHLPAAVAAFQRKKEQSK